MHVTIASKVAQQKETINRNKNINLLIWVILYRSKSLTSIRVFNIGSLCPMLPFLHHRGHVGVSKAPGIQPRTGSLGVSLSRNSPFSHTHTRFVMDRVHFVHSLSFHREPIVFGATSPPPPRRSPGPTFTASIGRPGSGAQQLQRKKQR